MDSRSTASMFEARYADVYKGDEHRRKLVVEGSDTYQWRAGSTYIANPLVLRGTTTPKPVRRTDIVGAKPLAILGDSVTTDHISPAGSIKTDSPAASSCSSTRCRRRTSTPTARGAAITT